MELSISMHAIENIPDIKAEDDFAGILIDCLGQHALQAGDIVVIAHKVISKAEGQVVKLSEVTPSVEAIRLAHKVHKDPRKVEVVLAESKQVIKVRKLADKAEGLIITEHKLGFICANSAVDESNTGEENTVILLPKNPDQSAQLIRARLEQVYGGDIGVIITDTFGRPWRMGLVNVAIGLSGVPAQVSFIGEQDAYGRELSVTVSAIADELAAASGLLMSKSGKKPAIVFRGVNWQVQQSSAQDLLRPKQEDLFR